MTKVIGCLTDKAKVFISMISLASFFVIPLFWTGVSLADITAVPSGTTVINGVLTPQSSDTVTVDSIGGTNAVSIDNKDALNVTVNMTDGLLQPANTKDAINLGDNAKINISATSTVKSIIANDATIVIRGTGNVINNNGEIFSAEGTAIQGNLFGSRTDGAFLLNYRKIKTVSSNDSTVNLGASSNIINHGEITLEGGELHSAISVSDSSTIVNEAAGLIEAKELVGATSFVRAVSLFNLGTLTNKGTIRVIGDINGSPRGTAVEVNRADTLVENSGTIDASRGSEAIKAGLGQILIDNSGTIIGGINGAIRLINSEGSELTLKTGSQITGDVLVRVLDKTSVRKTDAELGSQALIDFCNQNPSDSFCYKTLNVLPQNAYLTLEGTGTEDDRLTGFNQIEKRDAGTWTLDTDFQAGSASDFYQTGDFRGTLSIDVQDLNGRLSLTGDISDNPDGAKGQLAKNGVGTLVLSGTNTYSGPTAINGGTLEANGGNAIGDSSAVTVASGAALTISGSTGTTETIGSLEGNGDLNFVGATGLRTGGDNTSTTFAGAISSVGALLKVGSGTLTLSGTSTGTGVVSIIGGQLNVTGTAPMAATVSPNEILSGSGIIGSIVSNQGMVTPGNSIGTLNVSNDYTQTATGTLEIELAPDGSANDLLAVGGAANLDGSLKVKGENGALLTPAVGGNPYTIITAGGGVNGQFSSTPPLGAFTFQPTYNVNDVQLGVTYAGFSAVQNSATIPGTGTTNQLTKTTTLDKTPVVSTGFNSGNADFDQILLEIANETADELAATINAIIAEPYAAFMSVLLEQNDFYAETVLDRAQVCSPTGRGTLGQVSLREPNETDPDSTFTGCGSAADPRRHGAWLDATWVAGDVDGEDGLSGYDYRTAGVILGYDTAFKHNLSGGVAVGFGQPKLDSYDLADAEIDGDSYFVSTYGTYTRNRVEIAGLLGYTFGSYDSERRIRFGSIDRTARGDFDGDGVIVSAKAAYFYNRGGYDLVPEVGLTYSKVWQDGFVETGADSLNLKIEDADAYSVVSSVGLRMGTMIESGSTQIRPHALVRYEYDWNAGDDNAHDLDSSFAELPGLGSIPMIGQNRGEHGVTVGGGGTIQVTESVDLFADAGYRWNSNGEEYTLGAGLRMSW